MTRLSHSSYAMVNGNRLLVLCAFWHFTFTEAQNLSWTYNNSDLSSVILFIVRERISKLSTMVVVAEQHSTPHSSEINTRLLENLLRNVGQKISVQLDFGDDKLQLWEYYVFIVDSVNAFRLLQWKFPQNYFERRFNFFIILTEFTPHVLRVMRRIFLNCYLFHVINVTLIVDDPLLGVCLYTYKLFTEDECKIIQPVIQYRFNRGFNNLGEIFEKKLTNLYGCPLKVVLRVIPPQVIFTGDPTDIDSADRWKNITGIEGELLRLIAETMNFTVNLMPFLKNHYAPNYFAELKAGRADVAVGSFSASDPHRWVTSPSVQYHQSPYVFVMRLGHMLGSFDRLMRPFAPKVWWLLGLLLFVGMSVIYVLLTMKPAVRRFVFGNRNETPLSNFFGAFLGYPIPRMPRRNFARFLLGMWLLVTLVIRNAYQSALYDAIRLDKFIRLPSGYDDLVKWNFNIIISRDINDLNIFRKNDTILIVNGTYMDRIEMLKGPPKRLAAVLLMDSFLYYINTGYNYNIHVQAIPEVIYRYQMVMYFPKNSIYVTPFNKKLQSLASSGITQAICSRFYSEPGLFKGSLENAEFQPLINERLMALYEICGCGLLLATIVFILEMLSKYFARIRGALNRMQ